LADVRFEARDGLKTDIIAPWLKVLTRDIRRP
jgi:hypothetical protein